MLAWGGYMDFGTLNTGGRYDPDTDSWTPTSTTDAPSARSSHTTIWTGTLMVVWGGFPYTITGGRYDPATDSWTPTSTMGAPSARADHTAVWTGTRMIVWGGNGGTFLNTGGRYDPATDSWISTSTTGAPSARADHTAVWTGSLMVVYGGRNVSVNPLNTGGRYDPDTDTWTSTSTLGAPSARCFHTAVWTGTLMVVWGGFDGYYVYLNTGGRYDPATDTWTPTSTVMAPSARYRHTAAWTGTRMIVWGGNGGTFLNTGGRYNPATDSWISTSTTGAPSARYSHTAVWTGTLMVVWGGLSNDNLNAGGRYNPDTDTWTPTSTVLAPSARYSHTAVWTGSLMVVWGGSPYTNTGGRYVLDAAVDNDGDGLSECQGDCNDGASSIYPGAPQICDGLNNDCSDPSWPAVPADEADADTDDFRICAGDCDDTLVTVYPGAPQICDGINNDCSDPSWPAVPADEADADADGFRICSGDCNDGAATVYPGAPQICDGINNDCSDPMWPSLAGTNESDDDGDTFSECLSDCDDAEPATYSGAVETNDGKDNQCPGNPGFGIIDEISGALAFSNPDDPGEISWPTQTAATSYEGVRSTDPGFPPVCAEQITQVPLWSDPEVPAMGSVFFYLVRPIAPYIGSWGQDSSGAERVGLCGAESNCTDGVDDDSDGQTDCDDPDCFLDPACAPATFTFVDTLGDDIAPAGLYDFFSSITAAPTDYILFSISGPDVTDFKWCSERADFYRDNYLAMAVSGGSVTSGTWNRWSHLEGGSWVGPDTTGYLNSYSWDCVEIYAWCAESGLAGRYGAILPDQTTECEAVDLSIGCGTGSWVLTIQVGPSRPGTCGF